MMFIVLFRPFAKARAFPCKFGALQAMSTPAGYSVGRFLDQVRNSTLKSLLSQARRRAHLESRLLQVLPAALQPHVRLAGIRDKVLILLVDSAEWGMAVRLHEAALRTALAREAGTRVRGVRVRVAPALAREGRPARPRRRARPIRPASAEVLAATARSVDDPRLAEALMRLAARVERE